MLFKKCEEIFRRKKTLCYCGAPEVVHFDGDDEGITDMALHEGLLNLTFSVILKGIKEDKYSDEELEELREHHTIDSMLYILWYTDEEMC